MGLLLLLVNPNRYGVKTRTLRNPTTNRLGFLPKEHFLLLVVL